MSLTPNFPILEFNKVSFGYPGKGILIKEMDLAIESGEFIGLLGANGSGKSTILKLFAGFLRPSIGNVRLWGKDLSFYRNRDRAKLISYLPQVLDITIPFSVRELVSMGLYPYEIKPDMTVEDALGLVGLRDKSDLYIMNLSGGERRRVFIAMTLLQGSGILLLDEPLANLDIKYRIELLRLLRELRDQKGITVVMALHDINMAFQFEKVIVIKDGKILCSGNPSVCLTKETIHEAFDISVEINSTGGHTYISY